MVPSPRFSGLNLIGEILMHRISKGLMAFELLNYNTKNWKFMENQCWYAQLRKIFWSYIQGCKADK